MEKNNTEKKEDLVRRETYVIHWIRSIVIFLLASFVCYIFVSLSLPDTNLIVVYMLALLLIVWTTNSVLIGGVAAVGAVFVFNYFFSEPLYTFSISDPNYFVNFVIMMVAVFLMGALTSRARRSAQEARKNEEQRLAAREETIKERYRGNLLRSISHDIRTPLSSIVGSAEMLSDMCDDSDAKKDIAQDIVKDAEWLRGMVDNILSLTRLQEDDLILKKNPEPVEEVIGGAISKVEVSLEERIVETDIPDDVLMVPMDGKLVEQVLINLLDNAIKHTKSNGTIRIGAKKIVDGEAADKVEFYVSDNGTGIKEEDLQHMFEMFYTEGGRKASGKEDRGENRNMGLGLAICETIVKAHGGAIRAKNNPSGGAKISFTLPY